MGRPAKSSRSSSSKRSKAEKNEKAEIESALRGKSDKVDFLTMELSESQMKIRKKLREELVSELSNVDVFLLDQAAVTLDRIITLETQINEDFSLLASSTVVRAKNQYFNEYIKLCNELCMSPQARAKFANAVITKKEENPLLKLLGENDD